MFLLIIALTLMYSIISKTEAAEIKTLEIQGKVTYKSLLKVIIDPNDGLYKESSNIYETYVKSNEEIDLTNIKRDNYNFINWTYNNEETITGNSIKITKPTTLKANWEAIYYNVTINPNGGIYNGTSNKTIIKVQSGDVYNILNATRENYIFDKWEINPSSIKIKDNTITITNNIELKALWNEKEHETQRYKLTLDPNGGLYNGSTENYISEYDENEKVTLLTPSKVGYDFDYWELDNGTINLVNVDVTSKGISINNKGIYNISGSSVISDTYSIYDTGTRNTSISNSTTNYVYKNSPYKLTINNSNITKELNNANESSVIDYTNGKLNNLINSGTTNLNNLEEIYHIRNSNNNINMIGSHLIYNPKTNDYGNVNAIDNYGNIYIEDSVIDSIQTNSQAIKLSAIYNYKNNVDIVNSTINNSTISTSNDDQSRGIYNKGTVSLDNTNINTFGNHLSYGIYNESNISIKGSSIKSSGKESYGIYNDSGNVTLGEKEDESSENYGKATANVSITNPYIEGIGSMKGIGFKNVNGNLYYYDGLIKGNTEAKPEIAQDVEYLYEAIEYTDENGYKYTILEFMR